MLLFAVSWNQFNTSSNPVPIETFLEYCRIDHLWAINPLKSHQKSLKFLKPEYIYTSYQTLYSFKSIYFYNGPVSRYKFPIPGFLYLHFFFPLKYFSFNLPAVMDYEIEKLSRQVTYQTSDWRFPDKIPPTKIPQKKK